MKTPGTTFLHEFCGNIFKPISSAVKEWYNLDTIRDKAFSYTSQNALTLMKRNIADLICTKLFVTGMNDNAKLI